MVEAFSIGMLLLGLEPIMVRSQSIFHRGGIPRARMVGTGASTAYFEPAILFKNENQDSFTADPHALSRLG